MGDEDIDYESATPPYRQIAARIIKEIEDGTWRPGRRIPSEADMVRRFGVARDTARRTVRYLREEGYVHTVPQRGTFVVERTERPPDPPATPEPSDSGVEDER